MDEMYKQIKDLPLKQSIDGTEDVLIQSNGITMRVKSSQLKTSIDLSNYYTKSEVDDLLANIDVNIDMADYYDKATIDNLLLNKANVSHTHTSADITDLSIPTVDVNKAYVDSQLANKSNTNHTHDEYISETELNEKGYATETYVQTKIAEVATGGTVDLSNYATKTELTTELNKKANLSHTHNAEDINGLNIPTKLSELQNDSGFISEISSEYINETELNNALANKANTSDIPSLEGYATETYVTNKIAEASLSGGEVDLSGLATKDELATKADKTAIPTKTSQLTNDSGFLTAHQDISGKANKTYVDEELDKKSDKTHNHDKVYAPITHEHKQYLTSHQDLSDYALKTDIPTVPTKTSQLTNDSGFIKSIPSEYITETELSAKSYATETYVQNKIAEASLSGGLVTACEPQATDVPKVFFNGEFPTSKDSVTMEFEYVSLTDQFKGYVDIKCQGTSSMGFPKKNFTIKLYEDKDLSIKIKKDFKKWGKQNKFCLKANWVDTTHTRNISGAKIAYDMVESRSESEFKTNLQKSPRNGAIDGFPIKVYLNGMFHGIYTWNIPKDAWMFGMDESNPNHMVLCAEVNNDGNMLMANSCQFRALWDGNDGAQWSIEVGTLSDSLKNSFNNAISHVMNSSDEDFKQNLGNYFDVNSLIDYYLFSYLTCHIDGLAKNMLMATYDGIHWGACLYDMDSIYGANWNGDLIKPYNLACPDGYQENNSLLWQRIVTNFSAELYNRYNELRKNALSIGNIVSKVENINEIISDRDFIEEHGKWNLPAVSANTLPRFREFMNKRCEYVDKIIADMDPTPRPVESISIPSSFTIPTGSSTQLKVTYTPTNTNQKGVTWSISPDTYATIDAETGLITANSVGTCVVTATSITNPEASATCSLNIIEANHTLIDHITTNKTQYFDTGLSVTDTMKVETDITILSDTNYDHVFGIGNRFKLQTTANTLSVNKNYIESKVAIGVYKNVRRTYIVDMADSVNALIVDGTGYTTGFGTATDTTPEDVNLLILGGYYNNKLEAGHVAVDLYRFKVYDNGALVRDYVPVLKDGSIPCLYDNVNGTYCEKVIGDDLTYTE